ncbi:28754_t:CDS:2, partial [Dentiscutata erythropus]
MIEESARREAENTELKTKDVPSIEDISQSSACSELPVTSQAQKVDPIESLSTSPPIENHSEQIANTIAIIS